MNLFFCASVFGVAAMRNTEYSGAFAVVQLRSLLRASTCTGTSAPSMPSGRRRTFARDKREKAREVSVVGPLASKASPSSSTSLPSATAEQIATVCGEPGGQHRPGR